MFPLTWSKVPPSKRRRGPMATRRDLLALAPELEPGGVADAQGSGASSCAYAKV